jgi:hypothetical protein
VPRWQEQWALVAREETRKRSLDFIVIRQQRPDLIPEGGFAYARHQMNTQKIRFAVQLNARRNDVDGFCCFDRVEGRGKNKVASVDPGVLKNYDGRAPIANVENGKVLHASERSQAVRPEAFAFDKVIPAFDGFAIFFRKALHALCFHGALNSFVCDLGWIEAVRGGFLEYGWMKVKCVTLENCSVFGQPRHLVGKRRFNRCMSRGSQATSGP